MMWVTRREGAASIDSYTHADEKNETHNGFDHNSCDENTEDNNDNVSENKWVVTIIWNNELMITRC